MSYAISNNSSNSSLMAEIFSRRTQENSALQESQEKPQNKIADANVHASSETRANSTEYPRPSMNALIFVEEQSATDEILEEMTETEAVQETTEQKYYMAGDPNADFGNTYTLGLDYVLSMDYSKTLETSHAENMYQAYANKYGTEKADTMYKEAFGEDYVAPETYSSYTKDFLADVTERTKLIYEEIYKAMEDLGIEPTEENYFALAEDMELLQQVEDRLAERMTALGISPTDRSNAAYIDPMTGEVSVNGEVVDTVKFA